MTHDKLIFPSAITRILHHFSIPIPVSPFYTITSAISATSVQQSEALLRPKRPQTETTDPPAPTIPSTFTLSSSSGGVTLDAIMAQLQRIDACLDTLSDELCQVNTHVNHFYILITCPYFRFTLRCLDEFCLKCFRKIGCQNLLCHELSSCKVFQDFVLGLDFIVFNK